MYFFLSFVIRLCVQYLTEYSGKRLLVRRQDIPSEKSVDKSGFSSI
jgi:hypothetical protein